MSRAMRQIVNSNDEVVAHKPKDEIDFKQDIYRVAALWLTDLAGNKVLLAQRGTKTTNSPGLWGPAVAGTVEQGETYETNIYKEAMEEIGLNSVSFTLGPKQFHEGDRRFFCQWFTAQISQDIPLQLDADEVGGVEWIGWDALLEKYARTPELFIPNFARTIKLFEGARA